MEDDFGLKGYKQTESYGQVERINLQDTSELILFQIPPQFDSTLIDGLEIDLNQDAIQIFKFEDRQIGVLVSNQEITSYLGQQIIPIFMKQGQPKISTKPFTKVVKVFHYHDVPEIQKHSIVKLKPITLKTTRKKQSKKEDQ